MGGPALALGPAQAAVAAAAAAAAAAGHAYLGGLLGAALGRPLRP